MSVYALLENVKVNTTGLESSIRQSGNHAPPAKMFLQIAITGTASVQLQVKVVKTAPWIDFGAPFSIPAVMHLDPLPFIRAIASDMGSDASVSVWVAWGWY